MARSNRGKSAVESAPLLDRQPTRVEVLDDLEKLRTGYGISHERVRLEASALKSLDATEDELARRQPATVQREVAAFDVVKCAIEHDIIRTDLHLILKYTLNFVGKDVILTDRVEAVRKLLCLGKDTVERRYAEAYGGLASVLVSHGQSPCRERDVQTRTAAADMAFLLEMVTKSLTDGVAALTIEARPVAREAIARAIVDTLPRGLAALAALTDHPRTRPEAPALEILHRFIGALHATARAGGRQQRTFEDYLLLIGDPPLNYRGRIRRTLLRARIELPLGPLRIDKFEFRRRVAGSVAAALEDAERDDSWERLLSLAYPSDVRARAETDRLHGKPSSTAPDDDDDDDQR